MIQTFPHVATYWGAPTLAGYGVYTFAAPVQVNCRWEDKNEEFINDQGNDEMSQAVVYLDTDVAPGGYLFLGTSAVADPTTVDGAHKIKRFTKIPDVRAVNYQLKAWL